MVLIEPDIKFTRIVPVLLKILAVNPCPVQIMPLKKKKKRSEMPQDNQDLEFVL